jgi:tetratricopeptide (TPR) repeat protein
MLTLKLVGSLSLTLLLTGTPSFASSLTRQLNSPVRTQDDTRETADRSVQSGIQAQQSGSPEQAIAHWQTAIEIYRRIGEVPSQGRAYDLLGMTYINLGRLNEAENAFRRSLGIARDLNNTIRQIYGYNNVGQVILQRGQTREAAKSFEEGLRLARSIRHQAGQGLSLSNLGLASSAQ